MKKLKTVSEVRKAIDRYLNKPGIGFKPRAIEVDLETFDALFEEISQLIREETRVDPVDYSIKIMGVPVIRKSQVLEIK